MKFNEAINEARTKAKKENKSYWVTVVIKNNRHEASVDERQPFFAPLGGGIWQVYPDGEKIRRG